MTMEIKTCKRCGEPWCFHGTGRPIRCGKCKSPYWDRERINGGNVEVMQTLRPADEAKGRQETAGHVGSRKRVPSVPEASEKVGEWSGTSKCKHGWQNSFVCERNNGGCNQ